jgi:glycosyltransferase involved in cell wall biosynthesis
LTVVQALGLLPPQVCLQLAGYETIGHKGYVAELLAEARRLGVGDRVEYLGVFRHDALLPLCRRASVGLALMPRASGDLNEQTMAGASNKPFEYLACGVPLLVTDLPEWRTTFVEPGYARACDPEDVRSLAQAIREFFEQPGVTREMGQRGRERILHEWNYEGLFALVLHNIVERQDGI